MKYLLLIPGILATVASLAQEEVVEPEKYFPQKLTAKDLLFTCAASALTNPGRERKKYCSGFVSGVEEAVRLLEEEHTAGPGGKICLSRGMTASQLADVYMKYASRKNTDLSKPAAMVVIDALEDAFPCTK